MLTNEETDFILESVGNYIEVGHGDELQPYFEPVVQAIDEGRFQRIAVKACHAVGKTFTIARVADAIMGSYSETKLISTAPTYRQVHDLLWKEITTAYQNKLPELKFGRLNETELWIDSETYARGFSPQKRVKSEVGQGSDSVFQGYHGKYMTVVIFDEATGVDAQLWDQAEGLLNQGYRVLFLVIGNPTSRNCKFFKTFQDRLWKTFTISCFDSPNLKANNIQSVADIDAEVEYIRTLSDEDAIDRLASYNCPVPYLINTRWVIEKAIEWNTDHPLFLSKVLGEFPDSDSDVVATEEEVVKSQAREECDLSEETQGFIGLDVARFGIDKSVLSSIIGDQQISRKSMSKNDTNQVVGHTINYVESLQEEFEQITSWRVCVDGGFGHGVIDRLRELKDSDEDERIYGILESVEILEINFGSTDWVTYHYGWIDEFSRRKKDDDRLVQEDRENYANFKAKMFDVLSLDIKQTLKLANDHIYAEQLPTIMKQVDSKGRLKIESKEDYKVRTGETSPDEADSLALCNFGRHFAFQGSIMDIFKK